MSQETLSSSYCFYLRENIINIVEQSGEEAKTWFRQAVFLGLEVDKGKVFQKVGENHTLQKLHYFQEYPLSTWYSENNFSSQLQIELNNFTWEAIMESANTMSIEEWFARVITLRVMADNLSLFQKSGEDFEPFHYKEKAAKFFLQVNAKKNSA